VEVINYNNVIDKEKRKLEITYKYHDIYPGTIAEKKPKFKLRFLIIINVRE